VSIPTNENNSATGGVIYPAAPAPLPGNLNFADFLQQVFVALSGLDGSLVRPAWQMNPPPNPDVTVNWMKIALSEDDADFNAYVEGTVFQRMEELTIQCSFYGPDSYDFAKFLRDNLQIKQNLELLESGGMSFKSADRAVRAPDVVNERWCDRWEMSVYFRREILKTYPILQYQTGSGVVKANVSEGTDGLKTVNVAVTK
jgi:hypothetical protein